ncbi:MAG TPA: Gfo/Idh/MocA family oxidoreductase [Planctomicrobium sp.]|nr:Gfo/Idh/MocA family oxidoreductase [Planctomicrobium sp.]
MAMDLVSPVANRREFLGTAIAGGALLLSPLGSRAYAGNGGPLKVALIGSGARGAGAAAQALSTPFPVKLWAIADAFPDRLESSLKALKAGSAGAYNLDKGNGFGDAIDVPEERRFVGLDAYRKAIDCGVDVVIITGPPAFRPQHFEYAVNAGKHVFMEKPLATDPAGVRRILVAAQIAKEKNLKVGVGLQRHHESSYQEAVQRIHDGEIGRVVAIRAYWNGGLPAKRPIPRGNLTELEYQVRNWYFFNWLSGDHNVEQHIHNLDVGNWIAKAPPVSAEGIGGRQVRTGKEYGNIYDHHTVEYTYADGTKMYSQCRQIPGCQNKVAEFIDAAEGHAELGGNRFALSRSGEKVWQPERKNTGPKISPYQVEHNVLFDAIVNDKPHNDAENGAYSTLTAIMGRLATYSGKLIRWEDALNSNRVITTDAEMWSATAPVQPLADGSYQIAVPGVTEVL